MKLLSSLRSLLFVPLITLLLGLASGSSLAADEKRYEGLLLPDDFGGPISVTVELRDLHGVLVGKVTADSPFSGSAPVNSGEMIGDKCDFFVAFPSGAVLHLAGNCQPALFEGKYSQPGRRDAGSRGTFRLKHKEPEKEEEKNEAPRLPTAAVTVTDCIKANTRCLLGCPQGDYNVEFLCSNRCRTKFKACKAKVTPP